MSDFACTVVSLGGTGVAKSPESLELALFVGYFSGSLVRDGFRERKRDPRCVMFEIVALLLAVSTSKNKIAKEIGYSR